MGWDLSWLTGLFSGKEAEVKEPEILVFGAELKCSQGTENSFLMVDTNSICLDGLPQANVTDRVISENIMPFGICQKGVLCQQIVEMQEEWINPTPQKIIVRGKEAITTESFLLCNRCGGEIRAVNSGQDGVEAARIFAEMELLKEIEEKYPGLLEILMDPNGSLYLQEGMYQKALQFLSDCVEKYGGNIEILSLGNPNTLEGMLMNAALGHLVVEFDGSTEVWRRDRMTQIGTEMGFDGLPGWDVGVLNKDMMGFLAEICEDRAKKIENNSVWRCAESNKALGKSMYEIANTLAFMYIANKYTAKAQQEKEWSCSGGRPKIIENPRGEPKTKPQQLTREGQVPSIGKMADLNTPGNVVEGEFKIADYLPDMGNPKANWHQNSGILRSVMNEGVPIKDVSEYPMDNAGFLGAERNLLQSRGWTYVNGYWYPP